MHNWEHYNRLPAYLLMAALVASCGGGSSSNGGSGGGGLNTPGQAPAAIQLATPSVAVGLTGSEVVALTLTLSDNKTPIAGKQLTLTTSGGSVKVPAQVTTDAQGKAVFVLQGGGVAESGTITITYTDENGNKTSPTALKYSVVDGTGLTSTAVFSLDTSTSFKDRIPRAGDTLSTATFILRDKDGFAIPNAIVSFALLPSVASTGRLSAATGQTDANGKVSVTIDGLNQTVGQNMLGVSYADKTGALASFAIPFSIVDSYEILLNAATTELKTGQDSVVLTARVLDASNALIPNAKVSFQIIKAEPKVDGEPTGTCSTDLTNSTVYGAALPVGRIGTLTANSVMTDDVGQAKVTFEEFDNKNSTRRILATVDAEGLVSKPVACVDLNVAGTTLTLDPIISNAQSGDKIDYTALVRNARGVGIGGVTVDFIGGGATTPATLQGKTNSNGIAPGSFTVSGNASISAKVDSLNITQLSVKPAQIAVSDLQVLVDFLSGTDPKTSFPINTAGTLKITARDNGPIQGKVKLSTTLGTIQQSALTLDVNGQASTTIQSVFPGMARVDVVITKDGTGERLLGLGTLKFLSTVPDKLTLQSPVTTLSPKQQTEVEAEVLDENNNPVEGAKVDFNITSDSSSGVLSSSYAFTDSNGKASITYTAGGSDTALDGVQITAKILDETGNLQVTSKDALKLTVGGQALFVALARSAEISTMPGDAGLTNYSLPMSVVVTDASGHPVRDQLVSLDVIPLYYLKGHYTFDAIDAKRWIPQGAVPVSTGGATAFGYILPPYSCLNEDVDNDGFLDPGEDINTDNKLWPGNPVTVSNSIRTDDTGHATFNMLYGKNFANWLYVKMIASVKVSGSESRSSMEFTLPVATIDVNKADVDPPGGIDSFFGRPAVVATRSSTGGGVTSADFTGNSCTLKKTEGGITYQ